MNCVRTARRLTKSRFRLAIECAAKTFYSLNNDIYANRKLDDEFLEALAEGGHQVGALAKAMYRHLDPQAVEVESADQETQIQQTRDLLSRDRVTIFEPTIVFENLLVRVDVLVKCGDHIELIEVKAKSWDADSDSLVGVTQRQNPIAPKWEPYVFDVAFQHHVVSRAYPTFRISPRLLLVDKSKVNSVAGLALNFPIVGEGRKKTALVDSNFDVTSLKDPLLICIDATEAVSRAQNLIRKRKGQADIEFHELVRTQAESIANGTRIRPVPSNICKKCEFYCPPESLSQLKSGWAECMQVFSGNVPDVPREESIFGFYQQIDLTRFFAKSRYRIRDLEEDDLEIELKAGQISRSERQGLQWREFRFQENRPFVRAGDLRREMSKWQFPLHFIDFETATPAIPFHAGLRPYQPILFQFSHHRLLATGRIDHSTEYLDTALGRSPSIEVIRHLLDAIGNDSGTVLHWYPHERTILNAIKKEIEQSGVNDAERLLEFLNALGLEKDSNKRLVDLGQLVERQVFLPGTGGSSSMKKFLPATIRHAEIVRRKYSSPIYGSKDYSSHNFREFTWIRANGDSWRDPYELLNPLFGDMEIDDSIAALEALEGEVVANGAAAMIAYFKLQSESTSSTERAELEQQLRRYCELDTLAMVFVYEALNEWIGPPSE